MCPRKLGGHDHPLSRPDSHASSSAIKVGFGGRLRPARHEIVPGIVAFVTFSPFNPVFELLHRGLEARAGALAFDLLARGGAAR